MSGQMEKNWARPDGEDVGLLFVCHHVKQQSASHLFFCDEVFPLADTGISSRGDVGGLGLKLRFGRTYWLGLVSSKSAIGWSVLEYIVSVYELYSYSLL